MTKQNLSDYEKNLTDEARGLIAKGIGMGNINADNFTVLGIPKDKQNDREYIFDRIIYCIDKYPNSSSKTQAIVKLFSNDKTLAEINNGERNFKDIKEENLDKDKIKVYKRAFDICDLEYVHLNGEGFVESLIKESNKQEYIQGLYNRTLMLTEVNTLKEACSNLDEENYLKFLGLPDQASYEDVSKRINLLEKGVELNIVKGIIKEKEIIFKEQEARSKNIQYLMEFNKYIKDNPENIEELNTLKAIFDKQEAILFDKKEDIFKNYAAFKEFSDYIAENEKGNKKLPILQAILKKQDYISEFKGDIVEFQEKIERVKTICNLPHNAEEEVLYDNSTPKKLSPSEINILNLADSNLDKDNHLQFLGLKSSCLDKEISDRLALFKSTPESIIKNIFVDQDDIKKFNERVKEIENICNLHNNQPSQGAGLGNKGASIADVLAKAPSTSINKPPSINMENESIKNATKHLASYYLTFLGQNTDEQSFSTNLNNLIDIMPTKKVITKSNLSREDKEKLLEAHKRIDTIKELFDYNSDTKECNIDKAEVYKAVVKVGLPNETAEECVRTLNELPNDKKQNYKKDLVDKIEKYMLSERSYSNNIFTFKKVIENFNKYSCEVATINVSKAPLDALRSKHVVTAPRTPAPSSPNSRGTSANKLSVTSSSVQMQSQSPNPSEATIKVLKSSHWESKLTIPASVKKSVSERIRDWWNVRGRNMEVTKAPSTPSRKPNGKEVGGPS